MRKGFAAVRDGGVDGLGKTYGRARGTVLPPLRRKRTRGHEGPGLRLMPECRPESTVDRRWKRRCFACYEDKGSLRMPCRFILR